MIGKPSQNKPFIKDIISFMNDNAVWLLDHYCNHIGKRGPLYTFYPACADPEGGNRGSRAPLKNHKNIGFLSKNGLDPLKNVVPSSARQPNAI